MKVICNRGALLEALTVTSSVILTRTPKPVLQCVKLTAADNTITVSATDLEVAIRYSDQQVEVSEPGELLVPAEQLREIVRESVDDTLAIESSGDMAVVKGQDSLFKIYSQKNETFPEVPGFEGSADFQVPGAILKLLINQTIFASAKTSTRYAFNGVLINARGKSISFVSTDGHRLAQARAELTVAARGEKDSISAIVPVKALALVDRLIENPEESISFQIKENQVVAQTPRATLTSVLLEGQFPPYEDVIPRDTDRHMTAATAEFLSAIRRASLVTTQESKGVRFKFGRGGLVLSGHSPEAGEATINFPCKYDGPEFEIGFNPAYVTEALKVVATDEVTLEMTAPNRPGVLRAGGSFLYVIMPVSLQA